MKIFRIILPLIILFSIQRSSFSEITDPLDPLTKHTEIDTTDELDKLKSADQLVAEAEFLLEDSRLLDARTKLLRALEKDPRSYRAHMMLSGYYMVHVGHFKLALKYVKQAEKLFEEENGLPPYKNEKDQLVHGQLLYLLSQARLNLDDYDGALAVLDEFSKHGYHASWYPGTRAWILMKLGKIDEAIRVARIGVLAGAEPGRTLNMLGILLSMHGDREESLKIFREAISFELSQGQEGQPATPFNNAGEVYKEMFDEDKAESSWLKATSMPDGCEHILPSLNLALLYIDQINLSGAKRALDAFESCVAQYPLRNGEEHRALESLARGRIALLSGHADEAIELLSKALENRQWFGKIGTSEGDLKAAAQVSIGQAYRAKANALARYIPLSILDNVTNINNKIQDRLLSWWYLRKARQTLSIQLNDLEDLFIRNTDSLIEYPTLGEVLNGFNKNSLNRKILSEEAGDRRKNARRYYNAYEGESLLHAGKIQEGLRILSTAVDEMRPKFDDLLLTHALGTILQYTAVNETTYPEIAERLFTLSRPAIRNYGALLIINSHISDPTLLETLKKAGFIVHNSATRLFSIESERTGEEYVLKFSAPQTLGGNIRVHGPTIEEVINRLTDTIFTEDILS